MVTIENIIDNIINKINKKNEREMSDVELMKLIKELIEYISRDQEKYISHHMSVCMSLFPIIRKDGLKLSSYSDSYSMRKVVIGELDNEKEHASFSIGHHLKDNGYTHYGTFNYKIEVYNKENGYKKCADSITFVNNHKELTNGNVYLYKINDNNEFDLARKIVFNTNYNNINRPLEHELRVSIRNIDFDRIHSYIYYDLKALEGRLKIRYGIEEGNSKSMDDSIPVIKKVSFLEMFIPDIPLFTKKSKYFDDVKNNNEYNCSSKLMSEVFKDDYEKYKKDMKESKKYDDEYKYKYITIYRRRMIVK